MHLEVLSRLSMLLMDDEFRTNLLDAADVTEFLAHIDEAERKKFPEEYGEEKQTQDQPEEGYRVLAVTACPTGIAHTYMAAESLENKANDVPDSGRIHCHGDWRQTGTHAWYRRWTSCKSRNFHFPSGRTVGFIRILWSTDCRICSWISDVAVKEVAWETSKIIRRNKTGTVISILWNFTDGCDYDLPRKSTNRSI